MSRALQRAIGSRLAMKTRVALGGDIRRLSVRALACESVRSATETVANGSRSEDWIGRFRQSYISLETGGDKTTNGEIGESVS